MDKIFTIKKGGDNLYPRTTAEAIAPIDGKTLPAILEGKQEKDFVVTITKSGSTYSADKTYDEIATAHQSGRLCRAVYGNYSISLTNIGSDTAYFIAGYSGLAYICMVRVVNDGRVYFNTDYNTVGATRIDDDKAWAESNSQLPTTAYAAKYFERKPQFITKVEAPDLVSQLAIDLGGEYTHVEIWGEEMDCSSNGVTCYCRMYDANDAQIRDDDGTGYDVYWMLPYYSTSRNRGSLKMVFEYGADYLKYETWAGANMYADSRNFISAIPYQGQRKVKKIIINAMSGATFCGTFRVYGY